MLESIALLGIRIDRVNLSLASEQICQWAKDRYRTYVCVAPVATLVEAQRDKFYAAVVNAAGMVTPDGMPVVWLAKLKGCRDIARTYGPDLMRQVCNQSQSLNLRHFFYGGTPETLNKLQQKLMARYPGIVVAGSYAPLFISQGQQEQEEIIHRINESRSDILWVGLGSPKQDFWMHLHRPLLNVPVMIGIGAAFDFLSGQKNQAPRWIQKTGLEWFFRLCCEPKRLWKRYLVGNSLFFYYVIKEFMGLKPKI